MPVYEDANNYYIAFTTQNGIDDATYAYDYAKDTMNQPKNTTIFFAVDYDATASEIAGGISDYFRAVISVFSTKGNANDYRFNVGVYGSGDVCRLNGMLGAPVHWLAGATGWSGTSTYTSWDNKQSLNTVTIGGITFDKNESKISTGCGWKY